MSKPQNDYRPPEQQVEEGQRQDRVEVIQYGELPVPELIKVNADIQTKQRVFLQWCFFFIMVIIFVACTVAIPEPILRLAGEDVCEAKYETQKLSTQIGMCIGRNANFTKNILVSGLEPRNQFLLIRGQFQVDFIQNAEIQELEYTVSVYAVRKIQKTLEHKETIIQNTKHVSYGDCEHEGDDDDSHFAYRSPPPPGFSSRNCESFAILYTPFLDYQNYLVVIDYTQEQFIQRQLAAGMQYSFQILTVNPKFTSSMIAIRYVFMVFSILTAIGYYLKLRKVKRDNWVVEQAVVLLLSFLLPFFNDPLYAITMLAPNRVTAIIGVLFFSNFICSLILYWLILYDRIVKENGEVKTSVVTWQKFLVCGILWVFFVVGYSILAMKYYEDPSVTFEDLHEKAFMAFKVLTIILTLVILLSILRQLISFCRTYDNRLWRYKLLGLFNIFFMMCLALFVISGSFEIHNLQGVEILICVAILNLHIYYQQFLWSPTQEGLATQLQMEHIAIMEPMNEDYENLEIECRDINNPIEFDEKQQPIMQQ